jgi:hypothetical protein
MNGSGHLEEDFSQPLFLCPVDLRKLFLLVGFDVVHRYEQMLDFCTENQFEDERDLLKKRLEILKNAKGMVLMNKKKREFENEEKQKSKRLKRK